jgi:hypothetical protein
MKTLYFLITLLVVLSCRNRETDKYDTYLTYKWGDDSTTFIENGYVHSKTHFDTILKKMVGDTLIPIKRIDSTLIITQIVENGKWELIGDKSTFIPSSDTIITYTVFFKFRNLFGQKIFFYNKKWLFFGCYKLLENNKDVIFDNFDDRVKFEIADFTIGDTINRELIQVENIINLDTYTLENAYLKSNKNIEFDIIGDSIILSISQREISGSEVDDIIKVVNNKLSSEPEYKPKEINDDYEFESYSWYKFGIMIQLQKMTYVGNDYYRLINSKLNSWTLYYSDNLMHLVLMDVFKNATPKSLILK